MIKKEDALAILLRCAKTYDQTLRPYNFLFVFGSQAQTECIQIKFPRQNFRHLTGVDSPRLTATQFYNACVNKRLSLNDLQFHDETTELKLVVLPTLLRLHKSSKMVGTYAGHQLFLSTETLIGGTNACMGFIPDSNYPGATFSVPNTALNLDIRDITIAPQKQVVAVFRKFRTDSKYNHLCMINRGITIETLKLAEVIHSYIDFDTLTYDF